MLVCYLSVIGCFICLSDGFLGGSWPVKVVMEVWLCETIVGVTAPYIYRHLTTLSFLPSKVVVHTRPNTARKLMEYHCCVRFVSSALQDIVDSRQNQFGPRERTLPFVQLSRFTENILCSNFVKENPVIIYIQTNLLPV